MRCHCHNIDVTRDRRSIARLCHHRPITQQWADADDTTLLVPENSDVDLADEFNHIKGWASRNRLKINVDKTKEIVLRQPRARYFHMPPP